MEFRGKRDAKSKKRRANDKVRHFAFLSLAGLLVIAISRDQAYCFGTRSRRG